MLTVRRLSVVIATRTLIENVSFDLAEGESLGLAGASGSGKSTILKAVAGLLPFQGEILIEGRDIRRLPRLERAKAVNLVFQDPYGALHPRHRAWRALLEPLLAAGMRADRELALQAMEEVGLAFELSNRFPHQLSGGQRQRLVIARALIRKPRLLLLDEPTSALDMTVQADILELLEKLKKSHGLSYLLVAHSPAILKRMCGRSITMESGRLVSCAGC